LGGEKKKEGDEKEKKEGGGGGGGGVIVLLSAIQLIEVRSVSISFGPGSCKAISASLLSAKKVNK